MAYVVYSTQGCGGKKVGTHELEQALGTCVTASSKIKCLVSHIDQLTDALDYSMRVRQTEVTSYESQMRHMYKAVTLLMGNVFGSQLEGLDKNTRALCNWKDWEEC